MKHFRVDYDAGVETGADELSLHRNENLFVGPEWTVEAARELVEEARISRYPDPDCTRLREALARHYGVRPSQVFVGNGADEVLADLIAVLRADHHRLHVTDVCFGVYPLLAERYEMTLERLSGDTFHTGRIASRGFRGLAVVDAPNSITGTTPPLSELLALAADPRSFLIWDNVYGEFAEHELPLPVPPNVAYVRSFSKFYALAGLRAGYCIASEELVGELLAGKDVFNVNALAQAMAVAALERQPYFEECAARLRSCRARLTAALRELGLEVHESTGIALMVRHPSLPGETLHRLLLDEGIAVRRFADTLAADAIRITVPPEPGIERLLRTLRRVLERSAAVEPDRHEQ